MTISPAPQRKQRFTMQTFWLTLVLAMPAAIMDCRTALNAKQSMGTANNV
jgi:hypothetical protein